MGEMAADALQNAVNALFNHDAILAQKVIFNDDSSTGWRRPWTRSASDHRHEKPRQGELCFVFGVLKIITDLSVSATRR